MSPMRSQRPAGRNPAALGRAGSEFGMEGARGTQALAAPPARPEVALGLQAWESGIGVG